MADYLALPAVSASIVKAVINECPRAAWHASWLGPEQEADDTDASDAGTIAHSILLEGNAGKVCVIDPLDHPAEKTGNIPDGWTNKSIRTARDVARAEGLIPVLIKDMAQIEAMVDSADEFIASLKDTEPAIWAMFLPGGGDSELTVTWADTNTGVPCRMRADRISTDRKTIVDVKTTQKSANPDQWEVDHVGAAFYRRGCRAAFGADVEYFFLVIEQHPPYLCSIVGTDPHAFALGDDKVSAGLGIWNSCEKRGEWPAYPNRVCYQEIKPWVDAQWEEKLAQYDGMEFYQKLFGGTK